MVTGRYGDRYCTVIFEDNAQFTLHVYSVVTDLAL